MIKVNVKPGEHYESFEDIIYSAIETDEQVDITIRGVRSSAFPKEVVYICADGKHIETLDIEYVGDGTFEILTVGEDF